MIGRNFNLFTIFFLSISSFSFIFPQHIPGDERGDPAFRIHSQLENNAVRTTIFNYGLTGRESGQYPIYEQTPYEWPKNSGEIYMAMTQLFIGGEVIDENNNIIHIIDICNGRTGPQGQTWNFEPIPGYCNQSLGEVANSKNPSSWPSFWPDRMSDITDPGWPGSWDGYLGKNNFVPGQEYYYKFSDDKMGDYDYYPDSTDLTRKGLGLIVKGRAIELDNPLYKDIIFYSYKIINDGTKSINKMGLSIWAADFVGGNGDSNDDFAHYDLENNLVFFSDLDGRAPDFGYDPVGMIGIAIFKSPFDLNNSGQLGITNIQTIPANSFNLNDDDEMWNNFMIPGNYSDTNFVPGEYDTFISSSYFSLQPGDSTELVIGVFLGNGLNNQAKLRDLYSNFHIARLLYNSLFDFNDFAINIVNPQPGQSVSGTINSVWLLNGATGNNYSDIFLSNDNGDKWTYLGQTNNTYNFNLNTLDFNDGILNKLLIISSAENGYGFSVMQYPFIINNPSPAPPQIYVTSLSEEDTIIDSHQLEWIAGDADGDSYSVNLFYKNSEMTNWIPFAENLIGTHSFQWDTRSLPNSGLYSLYCNVIAGNDTGEFIINKFAIFNSRTTYDDSVYDITAHTFGTGTFEIHVVNSSQVTGHTYTTLFDTLPGNQLVYDVIDEMTGQHVVTNATETDGTIEGPYFNGIRLLITNTPYAVNPSYSGWNNPEVYGFNFEKILYGTAQGHDRPADYKIIMGPVGIDTSTTITPLVVTYYSKPVNFKVKNLTENKYIDFGFMEVDSSTGSGRFSIDEWHRDRIVFLEDDGTGLEEYTYWVYLNTDSGTRLPDIGDTLTVIQYKAFLPGDYFTFNTENVVSTDQFNDNIYSFKLYQNYPNPFNPVTIISYSIPSAGHVELKVYDILGRLVRTLVNSYKNTGQYKVEFNGSNLASGVYIYRLTAGNFSASKKLLLLK